MKNSVRRLLAASTAAAVATVGTLAMTGPVDAAPSPAAKVAAKKAAKKAQKKYGMSGNAYGTLVTAGSLGVRSDKTSHSWVGCTAKNKGMKSDLVGGDVLPDKTFLDVGVVRTRTLARKGKKAQKVGFPKGTKAGTVATSKVADVKLLGLGPLSLDLTGLSSEARAWVNKNGKFKTKHGYNILDIKAKTGIKPLDDLLNNSNSPLQELIKVLKGIIKLAGVDVVNGVLKVAKLGEFRLGKSYGIKKKKQAWSNAVVLEVRLYGADGKKSSDDITVKLGHSRARVVKGLEKGKFGGHASGLRGKLLDGVVQTARLAHQPLPCTGTGGKWNNESVAGVDLLNAGVVEVGAVTTGVLGKRGKKKAGKAGSRANTARVAVGGKNGLVINAIKTKVIAKRNKAGKLKRNAKFSYGKIQLAGQKISLNQLLHPVVNGLDGVLKQIGIARIKSKVTRKSKNGVSAIGLHIKLLDGKGANVKIGDVEARVVK